MSVTAMAALRTQRAPQTMTFILETVHSQLRPGGKGMKNQWLP